MQLVTYKGTTGYVHAYNLIDPSVSIYSGKTPADWGAAAEEKSRPLFIYNHDRKSNYSADWFDAPVMIKEGAFVLGELQNWTLVESAGSRITGSGDLFFKSSWQPIRVRNRIGYIPTRQLWRPSAEATVTVNETAVMYNHGSVLKPKTKSYYDYDAKVYIDDAIRAKKGTKMLVLQRELEPIMYAGEVYSVAIYYNDPERAENRGYKFAVVRAEDVSLEPIPAPVRSDLVWPVDKPKKPSLLAKIFKPRAKTDASPAAAQEASRSATVTSVALNMRTEPSANGALIKTLKKGDTLTVTGETANGWTPVEHDGAKGYVSAQYIERK
jgi:hypothetical protein